MKQKEDKLIALKQKEISPFLTNANTILIEKPEDMQRASEILSRLNLFNDNITAEKEKILGPALEIVKVERARWKPLETLYRDAIDRLRAKMTDYQTEQIARAKAEADKIAARVGAGKGHLRIETALDQIAEIDKPEQKIATEAGSIRFQAYPNFEIMDAMQIFVKEVLDHNKTHKDFIIDHAAFDAYFTPNETAIRQAMKNGIELSGIRYFVEQRPVNKRNYDQIQTL